MMISFKAGGFIQLLAGSLALVSCVLDYCWSSSNRHVWDVRDEYSLKSNERLGLASSAFALVYTLLSVPAALSRWKSFELATISRVVQLFVGCITFVLILYNNRTPEYYKSSTWHGVHSSLAQFLILISVLLASLGHIFTFDTKQSFSVYDFAVDLLHAVYRRLCEWKDVIVEAVLSLYQKLVESFSISRNKRSETELRESLLEEEERDNNDEVELDVPLPLAENGNAEVESTHQEPLDESSEPSQAETGIEVEDESSDGDSDSDSDSDDDMYDFECGHLCGMLLRSAHAPGVFGCAAYVFALTVCAIAISVAFYNSEPNTSCYGQLGHRYFMTELTSPISSKRVKLKPFLFEFSDGKVSISNSDKVVWSTNQHSSFITVATGLFAAKEKNGMFSIEDEALFVSNKQSVDSVESNFAASLSVLGKLSFAWGYTVKYNCTFSVIDDHQLQFLVHVDEKDAGRLPRVHRNTPLRIYLNYHLSDSDSVFGFGERFSYLDLKASCVPVLCSEKGVGRGLQPLTFMLNRFEDNRGGSWQTTYSAIPHYITSGNQSLVIESTGFTVFDMTYPERMIIENVVPGNNLRVMGRILFGASPLELVDTYSKFSGRMKKLPGWITANGAIVELHGGTAAAMNKLQFYIANQVPLAAVYIRDWTGIRPMEYATTTWWNWELDTTLYGGFHKLASYLKAHDIKLLLYINPHLMDMRGSKRKVRRHLFQEAVDLSCLVTRSDGLVYYQTGDSPEMDFCTVDFTNPKCVAWFQSVLQDNVIEDAGFKEVLGGWMSDKGESLPLDATLHKGHALTAHNSFPQLWNEVNYDLLFRNNSLHDMVFISRSGAQRSPGMSSLYSLGEQLVTFDKYDGMASTLQATMSLGLSGFTQTFSDIGGYNVISKGPFGLSSFVRSKELLYRWSELSCFMDSIFKTVEGDDSDDTVQFHDDAALLQHFARFATIHSSVAKYRAELPQSEPAVRAMFLDYPTDRATFGLQNQFMLGRELVVCPVLRERVEGVECYLPAHSGRWQRMQDKGSNGVIDVAGGGHRFECASVVGEPCVLHRYPAKGTINGIKQHF